MFGKECTKSIVSGCCISDLPPLDHARPGRPSRRARAGPSSAGRRHSTVDAGSSSSSLSIRLGSPFFNDAQERAGQRSRHSPNLRFSPRLMHFLGHTTGQKFFNRSNEISCAAPVFNLGVHDMLHTTVLAPASTTVFLLAQAPAFHFDEPQ
jgi:hypothetical protein